MAHFKFFFFSTLHDCLGKQTNKQTNEKMMRQNRIYLSTPAVLPWGNFRENPLEAGTLRWRTESLELRWLRSPIFKLKKKLNSKIKTKRKHKEKKKGEMDQGGNLWRLSVTLCLNPAGGLTCHSTSSFWRRLQAILLNTYAEREREREWKRGRKGWKERKGKFRA